MIELKYPFLLSSNNVRAFLRVIREGESNQEDDGPESGYRAMYHPTERKFWTGPLEGPHPRVYELTPTGERSSAFGAYQFVYRTWFGINTNYGLADDISEYSQDCHAVALIHEAGALDDVIDGRFDAALRKCGWQWASLPDSTLQDGGTKVAHARAKAVWDRYGGTVPVVISTSPTQPEAPTEDRSTQARPEDIERINQPKEEPMAAPLLFVLPLLQSLFEAFTPLVRAKVTKALDKQGVDATSSNAVADNLMGIVKNIAGQATGTTSAGPATADPVLAVAAVKSDPKLLAQAEAQMSDYIDKIAPMLERLDKMEQAGWAASEDSMDRAAARSVGADDWMGKSLVIGVLFISGFLILLVAGVAITQIALLQTRTPTTEVWAALTGIIGTILGILGTVYAFKFGTTRQSQTKDFAIAELSYRRKS